MYLFDKIIGLIPSKDSFGYYWTYSEVFIFFTLRSYPCFEICSLRKHFNRITFLVYYWKGMGGKYHTANIVGFN